MEAHVQQAGLPCRVSVSIGTSTEKCKNDADLKLLFARADKAMYYAKAEKQTTALQ